MILIRADANELVGTGHVMRCLSIADAVAQRNVDILFITADHKGDALFHNSDKRICLETNWKNMDTEIAMMKEIIKERNPSLLLVDSYYVTEKYFNELAPLVRIAYIDDLNRKKWNIDTLINYNIYSTEFDYSCYEGIRLLLGPTYAPLRKEFKNLPGHHIGQVNNIMVSAGGADPESITEKIIKEVCPSRPKVTFHFIVGALNPRIKEIKSLEKENIILHINEKNMSTLMEKCDIAISAAGTTLYELCAAGIPSIIFTLANNQMAAAEQFSEESIMINAGDCRDNDTFISSLDTCLKELEGDISKRKSISTRMQRLVDGKGTDRIACNLLVRLKPAEERDFEDYYEVKCGQSEIFWMGYDGVPARDTMRNIFSSRLGFSRFEQPGDKRIYMIQADGNNVGIVQFTLSVEGLEFGLSVKESEQRKGYASVAMQQAVKIANTYSNYLYAHIRDDNIGSIRACMSAGLKPTDDVELKTFPQTGKVKYRKYILCLPV